MDKLKAFIDQYENFSQQDWKIISSSFRRREIKKNELILAEGQICKQLSFLESGLLRFFITKNGTETIKFFTVAPYFFTSQLSFNNRIPATESIQAIEDSVIWETTFDENMEMLKLPSWSSLGRKITQEVQFDTEEILEEIQTETAEDRYFKLLENQPELVQRVPLKYLASYLSIAPQSLSRIRKKITTRERS